MANELLYSGSTGLTTVVARIKQAATRWNGTAMVAPSTIVDGSWTVGLIAMTEQVSGSGTGTGDYVGNMPAVAAGEYNVDFYENAPAPGTPRDGLQCVQWGGTAIIPFALFATAANLAAAKTVIDAIAAGIASGPDGAATLDNQLAILAKLNTAILRAVSPVNEDATIVINQGDDYYIADGRALTWTKADYSGPAVGGLTVSFAVIARADYEAGSNTFTPIGTATAALVGDDAVFSVELTHIDTSALAATPTDAGLNYVYRLRATVNATGHVLTEALSALTCRRAQ